MNVMDMFNLSGRVALVTGGRGRYGKQIVLALAQAGAKVYIASREREKNEQCAQALRAQKLAVFAETVDLEDEKSIVALKNRLIEKEGKVDILVNNAVLRAMHGFNDDIENFNTSMRVNASGVFAITRVFGNCMAENGGGSIINIGSYMGILGADDTLYKGMEEMSAFGAPDYFFHKGGLTNLTRLLAGYYGKANVRCNCLQLGGISNGQPEAFVKRYQDRTFLKRMANDTDIMGAIIYLASDASLYMTGASIPLDGGCSAK